MSMARRLDVYLRADKVGLLDQDDAANLSFTYADEYLASDAAQAISVSMPLAKSTYANSIAKPYFSGLLPDESARTRLASALGISDTNAFGMLEIIGGECAGALALFLQKDGRRNQHAEDETLGEQQLADLLHELRGNPLLGGRDDVRLSLAGAQDKIAVKFYDEKIALVKNGEPTTHILKPSIEGLAGTAQNEVFCMKLASRVGLKAPDVRFSTAGDTEFILIQRFDRQQSSDLSVQRLHQEDFCQALSVPPELKYEDEGGPGIRQCQDLIQRVVAQPAADRLIFIKMQVFHYLVGNADAHAKNFALLYPLGAKSPSLAPVYDAVCTASYPALTKKMAMRIGDRNLPDTIHLKHWLSLVPNTKASQQLLIRELTNLAKTIVPEAEQLLAESAQLGFEHKVLRDVNKIIKSRAKKIMRCVASH